MTDLLQQLDPCQLAAACRELNDLEQFIMDAGGSRDWPVLHRFTDGLYSRTLTLNAGDVVTSKIHRTEHQFIISRGVAAIWSPEDRWRVVQSPFHGITKPGNRRAVAAFSQVVWTTFHATAKTDIAEIERDLFE